MTTAPAPKFRPYLTLSAMERILQILPETKAEGIKPIDNEIRIALQSVMLKASIGVNKPAYTPSSIKISTDLGMVEPEPTSKLEQLWMTYVINPGLLTAEQATQAKDYAYANALMSPKQMEQYEQEQMNQITKSTHG